MAEGTHGVRLRLAISGGANLGLTYLLDTDGKLLSLRVVPNRLTQDKW
jgi:hypothetical protein